MQVKIFFYHIRKLDKKFLYPDEDEFHVIELPKLPELPEEIAESNCEDILLWSKFINAEQKEDFEMLASKSVFIESAYQQLKIISQDEEKRLEYEARQKAILDYNQSIYEAEQRGEQCGEYNKNIQIARNMIKKVLI